MIGVMQYDKGEIRVFGAIPGSKSSNLPGPMVGFMPQELYLIDIFTIKEMIHYFGMIYGMTIPDIKKTLQYFLKFFKLPHKDLKVKDCSGGQQRCVSMIISIMHKPKLLILDEPTVGLDPILRDNMWKYLEDTVRMKKTTIVITTHYIEEAVRADCVRVSLRQYFKIINDIAVLCIFYRSVSCEMEKYWLKTHHKT
jgi:ABC-type multidrug transport system ATPase subunit